MNLGEGDTLIAIARNAEEQDGSDDDEAVDSEVDAT
jgi:DNA gyrase subunit A